MALDPDYVKERLSSPPFVIVDGVSNARSLGNYPTSTGKVTREGFIFRSAVLSLITSTGIEQLQNLGVKKVFDFRADTELAQFGQPVPHLGTPIEFQRIPVFKDEEYTPENLMLRAKQYKSIDPNESAQAYDHLMESGITAYQTIFKHIRDHPDKGILYHCTSGKDRTGVLTALILRLAGVKDELIVEEYVLSKIGGEATRQRGISKLQNLPGFINDMDGLLRFLDTRPQVMEAFLKILDEKYQGVEGYMKNYLEFTSEDIDVIRRNLLSDK